MTLSSPSSLRALLLRHGFHIKKRLGQHFLTDANILRRIIEAAELPPDARTLEIGPGPGGLTLDLAAHSSRVVAIEYDRSLIPILEESVLPLGNVRIICADAIRLLESTPLPHLFAADESCVGGSVISHQLSVISHQASGTSHQSPVISHQTSHRPAAPDSPQNSGASATNSPQHRGVGAASNSPQHHGAGGAGASDSPQAWGARGAAQPLITCVSNLPYGITSPAIISLLGQKQWLRSIVVMVQSEVADRLAAAPGTGSYGALTVFVSYHARVEKLFTVSRHCFYPPPAVDSAVVRLVPAPGGTLPVQNPERLLAISRALFGQRRKNCLNALLSLPDHPSRATVSAALAQAGIDPSSRGETLSLAQMAELADALPRLLNEEVSQ